MKNVLAILLRILALKIMAHTNTNTSSHTFEYNFDNLFNQSQKVKYLFSEFVTYLVSLQYESLLYSWLLSLSPCQWFEVTGCIGLLATSGLVENICTQYNKLLWLRFDNVCNTDLLEKHCECPTLSHRCYYDIALPRCDHEQELASRHTSVETAYGRGSYPRLQVGLRVRYRGTGRPTQ